MEDPNGIELSKADVPEIGPNDIVVHLVNPYKCGICEEEYLERTLFMKHMLLHLKGIKEENPTSQLTMTISMTPDLDRGFTITRDILQLTPDGSIKQIKKLPKNVKPHQAKPLQELEEAGVINLDPDPQASNLESIVKNEQHQIHHQYPAVTSEAKKGIVENCSHIQETSGKLGVFQDSAKDTDQSTLEKDAPKAALVANDDGTFRFSFNPLGLEKQNIEIVPINSMDVEHFMAKNNFGKKSHEPKSKVFKKKTYECELCGKHLSCSTSLNRHKQYHKSEKPYVCEVCNKGFKDSSNLKKHTLIHKRGFACHMCKRSFLHKSLLEAHLRHHEYRSTFIKNGDSSEEVIVKTVVEADGTHIEIVSLKCLESTNSESQGQILKNTTLVQTAKSSVVEKDISSLKMEAKPGYMTRCGPAPGDIARMYRCGHCGKETIQRGNIMRHLFYHLKKKPNEVNQKQLFSKGNFNSDPVQKTHNRKMPSSAIIQKCTTKKNRSFKRDHCSLTLSHKFLNSHKRGRIGNTESVCVSSGYSLLQDCSGYYCKHCDKRLPNKYRMMCHVKVHGKDFPYECPMCNKCFRTEYLQQRHRKTHMLACNLCKQKHRGKLSLKLHMKECHNETQNKSKQKKHCKKHIISTWPPVTNEVQTGGGKKVAKSHRNRKSDTLDEDSDICLIKSSESESRSFNQETSSVMLSKVMATSEISKNENPDKKIEINNCAFGGTSQTVPGTSSCKISKCDVISSNHEMHHKSTNLEEVYKKNLSSAAFEHILEYEDGGQVLMIANKQYEEKGAPICSVKIDHEKNITKVNKKSVHILTFPQNSENIQTILSHNPTLEGLRKRKRK